MAIPEDADLDSVLDGPLSPTTAAPTSRSTALSNKLNSVLSSSYADPEIRTAFALLDARGLKNDPEIRRNLKLEAQKHVLDCNVQIVRDFGKVAEVRAMYLELTTPLLIIPQQLRQVGSLLNSLNVLRDEMKVHVDRARQESAPFLQETATLMTQRSETETKQQVLDVFKEHFILSDEDLTTLTSSAEPVNDQFFCLLARVKQIHKDCEILLGSENQRLGLELMEQTTRNLDAGFKKLYGWIQREFKGLDLEDPHISGSIRRALRVLSERPTMFQNCLDFFAEARQHTLATAFQAALTESTANGSKAIEFLSHDLLRYVGDMLAWVHATTVSEKEALEGLFIADEDEIAKGMRTGRSAEPWSRIKPADNDSDDDEGDETAAFDGRSALESLVSRNLSGVCQTLQNRIELAVQNSDEPVLIYKVLNLLNFYQTMFNRQIGPASPLTECISRLENLTRSHFEHIASEEQTSLLAEATPTTPDLTPPPFLTHSLSQLTDIIRASGPTTTQPEFEHLFSTLLSAPLTACAESSQSIPDQTNQQIFQLNYLTAVCRTLQAISAQSDTTDAIGPSLRRATAEADNLIEFLTDTTQLSLLDDSGVGPLIMEIRSRRSQARVRADSFHRRRRSSVLSRTSVEGTKHDADNGDATGGDDVDPEAESLQAYLSSTLESYATKLDAWLPFALTNAQERLKYVVDRGVVGRVLGESVEEFVERFEELEGLLGEVDDLRLGEEDGGEVGKGAGKRPGLMEEVVGEEEEEQGGSVTVRVRDLYPRTSAEVRALLS